MAGPFVFLNPFFIFACNKHPLGHKCKCNVPFNFLALDHVCFKFLIQYTDGIRNELLFKLIPLLCCVYAWLLVSKDSLMRVVLVGRTCLCSPLKKIVAIKHKARKH
jgi:hypothetical protein